jgi:uncharacterized membrane protein YbhN (UPF0104 family)
VTADIRPDPDARRRAIRSWVTWIALVVLLAGMAVYVWRNGEELSSIRRLSATVLLVTCGVQVLSQLALNASMLLPLQSCISGLGFWELYVVRSGGSVLGSLVPVAGGVAVRLAYLRRRGIAYVDFTWATLLSNVVMLAASAVVALLATVLLWAVSGPPPLPVLGVTAGVLALSGAAVAALLIIPRLSRYPRLRRWKWLGAMAGSRAEPRLTLWVFLWSMVRHLLNFVTFGLLMASLSGVAADFLTGGLVSAVTSPIRMVNVTPANLGVAEWATALVGRLLAYNLATGLLAALAFRGVGLVAQAAVALIATPWVLAAKRARPPERAGRPDGQI